MDGRGAMPDAGELRFEPRWRDVVAQTGIGAQIQASVNLLWNQGGSGQVALCIGDNVECIARIGPRADDVQVSARSVKQIRDRAERSGFQRRAVDAVAIVTGSDVLVAEGHAQLVLVSARTQAPASTSTSRLPDGMKQRLVDVLHSLRRCAAESPELEPERNPAGLERSAAAFVREHDALLSAHAEQWVAYHNGERLGIGADHDALVSRALGRGIPADELYVRYVEAHCPTVWTGLAG